MKPEYDFSKGKRGPVIPARGKTRVTMYLDNSILDDFRARAERVGIGYQTLINQALRAYLDNDQPLDQKTLRRIIREELDRTE